jgi:hypothetical protein
MRSRQGPRNRVDSAALGCGFLGLLLAGLRPVRAQSTNRKSLRLTYVELSEAQRKKHRPVNRLLRPPPIPYHRWVTGLLIARCSALISQSLLASRMREQLWRYYPQMLELADDLAADWFLDLRSQAPTPAKAARLRQTTIERFVKAHRPRRWQAPEVLRILKQKPLSVAPGVVEAASDHIRTLTVRIRLLISS